MARWDFSDGTTVSDNGFVDGTSAFAEHLRVGVRNADDEMPPPVHVVPPPAGSMPLDVRSVWMINLWLRQELDWWNVARDDDIEIDTDYKPTPADIPPTVQALLDEAAEQAKTADNDPPDTVY